MAVKFFPWSIYVRLAVTHFVRTETGAVTTDWVVLTAAVVALCLLAFTLFSAPIRDNSREVTLIMSSYEIDHEFDTAAEIGALQEAANAAVTAPATP